MTELMNKTLAQIVTANYKAAMVFEKYNLDFCCKGKRSLQYACAETGNSIGEVMKDLERTWEANPKPDLLHFEHLTLTQLADYVVSTHHQYIRNEAPVILKYLEKIAAKHGDQLPYLHTILGLFTQVNTELQRHMEKEELILFTRIKAAERHYQHSGSPQLNISYVLSPMQVMEAEHEMAGQRLEQIRFLTENYLPPTSACTTFRLAYASLQAFEVDLHHHVHLENNLLFPRALELFAAPEGSPVIPE